MEKSPDESETVMKAKIDHLLELMKVPSRWQSLVRRVDGVNVIDLAAVTRYPDLPGHRYCLLLLLFKTVRDRGDELRFEPWRFDQVEGAHGDGEIGFRVSYQVDGQLHELVPPPHYLRPLLAREIETIADLSTPRRRIANLLRRVAGKIDGHEWSSRQGSFRLVHGDLTIDVEVLAYTWDLGDRFFLKLLSVPDLASGRADIELKRIFEAEPSAS